MRNHCLIKNLLATFAVTQTCWSTLTCKISAWTTAKMLADLRKSRSWAGLLVLRCYLPWFLLVDSKVCISRSGCDFHFCLVKAPACLTIKTPAGKASTSFPLRQSKQSGPGVRLWRMDAPRTKKYYYYYYYYYYFYYYYYCFYFYYYYYCYCYCYCYYYYYYYYYFYYYFYYYYYYYYYYYDHHHTLFNSQFQTCNGWYVFLFAKFKRLSIFLAFFDLQ